MRSDINDEKESIANTQEKGLPGSGNSWYKGRTELSVAWGQGDTPPPRERTEKAKVCRTLSQVGTGHFASASQTLSRVSPVYSDGKRKPQEGLKQISDL